MAKLPVLSGSKGPVRLERDRSGVPRIMAECVDDAHFGLGWCHAHDRGLQMLLLRILARGQACEKLRANEELLEIDRFFRRLNFAGESAREVASLTPLATAGIQAYCRGVGLYFEQHKIPWELRLLGYRMKDDPWTVADTLLTARTVGYVGLAQTQGDLESFIVEAIRAGLPRAKLEELFPGRLHGLDEQLIGTLTVTRRLVPEALQWNAALPKASASNNWAVAGSKTASGKAMLCNDPHLEINRLPGVWYEAVLRWTDEQGLQRYAMGATMPGVPGIVVGRTPDLAWGVTYAFMDCIDSWIEDCRDGKYRVGDEWRPFTVREETIRRKRCTPITLKFYENHHGTLDGDPHEVGHYLATCWSGGAGASAESFDAAMRVLSAESVAEAMPLFARISMSSYNWVMADREGNIGYQMSGRMPLRREGASGLVPLPGWDPQNDWRGYADPADLPSCINPPEGFVATANDDLNRYGKVRPINACMGSYRADRIRAVLSEARKLTPAEMTELQFDIYSVQAQKFMAVLHPLLPKARIPDEAHQALSEWDLRYRPESPGPLLFERFYLALLEEVFGAPGGFGREVMAHLMHTAIIAIYFERFDRILLSEKSAWFGGRTREEIFLAALERSARGDVRPWGKTRRFVMRHLLLGSKLPRWMGLDRGPYVLRGSRATVHQGQMLRRKLGREATVGPSIRLIADMDNDELLTNCPGGVSDRRFSRLYNNGTADWLAGRLKILCGFETPIPSTLKGQGLSRRD